MTKRKGVKPSQLSLEIIGYILIALMGATFAYLFIHTATLSIASKVIVRSEYFQSYMTKATTELQLVLENPEIGEGYTEPLVVWNLDYPELQVSLYREDKLYYTTPYFQTSDYGLEEVYFFELTTPMGKDSVELYPCFTTKFMLETRIMSITASGILFVFFVIFLCQCKFRYLMQISKLIKVIGEGELSRRIPLEGHDELTGVAMRINALVDRIEQDIEEEKNLQAKNMQMVSSLSHDIRTPLTAVMSYLDFLERKAYSSPEQMEEYIQIASQKAIQIKAVTDALFAHAGIGRQEVVKKDQLFDVCTLGDQILLEIDDWLESAGFEIIYENTIQKAYEVSIDIILLRRVLDNLCSNIEKYGDQTKPVHAVIKVEEEQLIFSLSNGIKLKNESVESYGIGLQNCKDIIESYGGIFEVKSKKGYFEIKIYLHLQNSLELPIKNLQN